MRWSGGAMVDVRWDETFKACLRRYATLIAVHGLNVRPGQLVNVSSELYHREFVALVVEELYARGAKYVHVELADPILSRARILKSRGEFLGETPAFFAAKYHELVESGAANLKILGPEYPDHLADLNPGAVNTVRKGAYLAAKHFYTEGIEKSKVHWCVVAAATPAWALKIFPTLSRTRPSELCGRRSSLSAASTMRILSRVRPLIMSAFIGGLGH